MLEKAASFSFGIRIGQEDKMKIVFLDAKQLEMILICLHLKNWERW